MALGKYTRIDGNSSSNYCLVTSIMVFIFFCFVGVWMTMSSSISPLRVGVTIPQFMGGIPTKASLGSPEDTLKVNASRGIVQDISNLDMQGNGNVIAQVPSSLESVENHETEPVEAKDVDAGSFSNAPTVEEKSVSLNGEGNGGPQGETGVSEGADTSSQEVTMEDSVSSAFKKHEVDVKPGPAESPSETIQIGKTDTYMDVSGDYQAKPPSTNAVKIQDEMVNKTEKFSQEQSKDLEGDFVGKLSGPAPWDGLETLNGTSPQVVSGPTQSAESKAENEKVSEGFSSSTYQSDHRWKVCNVTAGPDYIPCLDNIQSIKKLPSTSHYEHRERHCPDEAPTCLVSLPEGYKTPIKWPKSRDMIWFSNVPHTKLADYKGGQNWVKVYGRYLTFPGGGTQFKYGARHYIDYLEETLPNISWGNQSRVVLDVGCGVASFGGYLFDRDVITMSLAPKDEHEAQVQFALERGIPAISAVMGTKRLPFPSMVFDIVHCARCRVPWHVEGGKLLLELNRILRPGGYFVWSATPVYRKDSVNVGIWKDMSELTKSICWELVKVRRDDVNRKAAAIFRKPTSNSCYEGRSKNDPPFCEESDDPNIAWYTPLQSCIHKVPTDLSERGSQWPPSWPSRLERPPYWLKSEVSPQDFSDDYDHWKQIIANFYLNGSGIDWSSVRNVMDMRASYGGFAAALKDLKVWVMNVVPVNSSDTLPIIYERGLFGIYHDWCESFSTYPRSYDLLHANQLFSDLRKRCNMVAVMAEVDRVLRPGGWLIVRDEVGAVAEVESAASSLHWKVQFTQFTDSKKLLCVQKTTWRPSEVETIVSAIG